ncbi:MAG: hypothetical protein AB7U20_03470 [Planctomycetaceae bacterium]
MKRLIAAALLCATCVPAAPLFAQVVLGPTGPENPDHKKPAGRRADEPIVYRLTVTPAPEPSPPLKYSLSPRWSELTPGNSVPMWYRALAQSGYSSPHIQPLNDNDDRWFTDSLNDMPIDEVRPFLQNRANSLEDARTAAFREETKWDLRLRDLRGPETITVLLGEFQDARGLARLLSLQTRVHLLDRDFDAALADMTVAFRLARDVAEPETLINDLIGIAIISITEVNIRHMIGMPGSPNLYWALATLPRPAIDLRDSTQMEMTLPERYFPWLKDPATPERTPEQWQHLLSGTLREVGGLHDSPLLPRSSSPDAVVNVALAGLCLRGYPTVKRDLIESGVSPQQVGAMPVGKAIALHQQLVYQELSQSYASAMYLPYPAAQRRFVQIDQAMRERGLHRAGPWERRETIPIASSLLASFQQAQMAQIRRDVSRAALMTVEAIRMHLAAEDGRFPKSLDEITVVPVPKNPWTEAPFDYELTGGVAVIDLPFPNFHQRYELRVTDGAHN